MSTYNRRVGEMRETHEQCPLDLSELAALYGEAGLRTLLAVALDEFDCQRLALDGALEHEQWEPAAQALHRLTGTAAFFVSDECALEPLSCAERALRLGDPSLIGLAMPAACSTLVALRRALIDERSKAHEPR
ncbi:hypothetical protein AB1286_04685 [Trinickia sp. NRRL B-1857]|uniref:hypothetical protein n=1 Tax=Trinickia sp. NRRL B-1857 TaxID=3162879 RepID=UPI003D26E7FB